MVRWDARARAARIAPLAFSSSSSARPSVQEEDEEEEEEEQEEEEEALGVRVLSPRDARRRGAKPVPSWRCRGLCSGMKLDRGRVSAACACAVRAVGDRKGFPKGCGGRGGSCRSPLVCVCDCALD